MDSEEIKKCLNGLSRSRFLAVVRLVTKAVFRIDPTHVDGKGDGGSDWQLIKQEGSTLRIAIQDTVQQNWKKKALDDAKTAKRELNVNRYIFFTNRPHQISHVTELEEKIYKETGLQCSIFEGRKISELIEQKGLTDDFLKAIGATGHSKRPDLQEMCLSAYTNLSADRTNHRDQVYRDTLLVSCYELQKPDKESLTTSSSG